MSPSIFTTIRNKRKEITPKRRIGGCNMNKVSLSLILCIAVFLLFSSRRACVVVNTSYSDSKPSSNRCISITTASLSESTMTSAVDDKNRPEDKTSTFSAETSEIHCSMKLSNAPPNTEITGELIYIEGEDPS